MKPETIDQLSAWLAATDIAVLELSGPTGSLRLEREDGAFKATAQAPDTAADPAAARAHCTVSAHSPGIFLHHHPMHTQSLVQPGASVTAGQVLGLLQIGALLLPVKAPSAARVEGLWVAHGTPVGFGAALVELNVSERCDR
jgi:acetyl-CoA carboxylase biotin carboxyl carrier protein